MDLDFSIALAFLICAACVIWTVRRFRKPADIAAAGILLFAVPYYCSPIFFKGFSNLSMFPVDDIAVAISLHAGYCIVAIVCLLSFSAQRLVTAPLEFRGLGRVFQKNSLSIGVVCAIGVLADSALRSSTAYQLGSVEQFVETTRAGGFGILGGLSDILLSSLAVATAITLKRRKNVSSIILLFLIATISAVSIGSVQRLSVILPVFMLVAALLLYGMRSLAVRLTIIGTLGLLILSPVLVLVRETNAVERTMKADFTVVADVFSERATSVAIASIVQRADLIQNTIVLKEHIDQTGFVGPEYYWSVLTVPVPRLLYPNKPIALSADGTLETEISVLAWQLSKSGVGSLTAFGGITAYRQGGWVALLLDAVCLGVALSILALWLGGGDPVSRVFFILILMSVSVKKAPASFFELCVSIQSLWPFMLVAFVVELALRWRR